MQQLADGRSGLRQLTAIRGNLKSRMGMKSGTPGPAIIQSENHRRRINTEEKAKVVAAVWGTELIQFLAALAILHQDD